jgi:hypothetical protein
MKSSVPSIDRGSMASNDNYSNRRVQYVDSEVASALVLDNDAAYDEAA